MGMVIEKRYHNLEKAEENPIVATQTSIVEFGRLLREAKSAHSVGKEKLLAYDCDIIEADTKELIEKMGGLVSAGKGNGLRDGKTKAWVAAGYGVPVKLEMYTPAWSAASENVAQDSITSVVGTNPGSAGEPPAFCVIEKPKVSSSVKHFNPSAAAAL